VLVSDIIAKKIAGRGPNIGNSASAAEMYFGKIPDFSDASCTFNITIIIIRVKQKSLRYLI